MSVASWFCTSFCVILSVSFCSGHFVMVPLNFTYLHCLQHSFFEHLFILYYTCIKLMKRKGLRKHSLHEKTAAAAPLKLYISGNE